MPAPSPISLAEQMLRRRPAIGAPVAHGASEHLERSIGIITPTGRSLAPAAAAFVSTVEATFKDIPASG